MFVYYSNFKSTAWQKHEFDILIKKRRKPQIQTKTIKKSMTDIDKDVQNIPPISKEYCLDAKIASKNTML